MVLSKADVEKFINRFENAVKDPKMRKLKKLEIARLYKDAKLPEKAKESLEEYMEVNKKDHRAFNLFGAVHEELEQWEEALKCYKKSIELACTQKDIFLKIIEVYCKIPLTQPEIAKVWADKAAKIFPNHPSVFNLRWHILMYCDVKDYDEMEDILAQELVINPRDVSLHIKLISLYIEKGDLDEAYEHCSSLVDSKAFQSSPEWLRCAVDTFECVYKKRNDPIGRVEVFMKYASVLCALVEDCLKNNFVLVAKSLIQKLDSAVKESLKVDIHILSEDLRSEVEVFCQEIRAQAYFFFGELMLKMAKEYEIPWNIATKFAFGLFSISSSSKEPNPKSSWFIKNSKKIGQMIWYSMACKRLSQTNHQILALLKMNGAKWMKSSVFDTCCSAGRSELLERMYQKKTDIQCSFVVEDKEFLNPDLKVPDKDELLKYDEIAIKDNPEDLSFLIWIGVSWHFLSGRLELEAARLVGNIFFEMKMDTDSIKNCSPFSVSSKDLEVFIEAVVYSAYNRFIRNNEEIKNESQPSLLSYLTGQDFAMSSQKEFWNAVYKLHNGKTWNSSTSKLKSISQKGLEVLRVIDKHGIDPRILKYISDTFLKKAEDILNEDSTTWKSQAHLQSLQKRGYYYAIEALRLLESRNESTQLKRPLIQPLADPIKETEKLDLITEIRMAMADAAMKENLHQSALKYLEELFTADSAYKEAQVYRDLAAMEDLSNVEGLRSHLSCLRKSRERLLTCLSRLDESQVSLRSGVQSEIDEIRDAIAEQSGITSAPNKVLEFRFSTLQETDNGDEAKQINEANVDSKLTLENTILHEQLAVRNHEFSVLAQRIYKLERDLSDIRKNQSGNESMLRSSNDTMSLSGNTEESSSSMAAQAPKDDAASGSSNLTPRLEPEMSWDPFSPGPVFDKGYFSGLAETVDKIEEELERDIIKEDGRKDGAKANDSIASREDENEARKRDEDGNDYIHVEPVVQLTKKTNQKTGEENEDTVFMERCKLYRLHDNQWKERGIGELKILLNPASNQSRILMRRDHVLKICANHLVTDDMKLIRKDGSPTTFIWFTVADVSEEEAKPETFAGRFKNQDIADKFLKVFTDCQSRKAKLATTSPAKDDAVKLQSAITSHSPVTSSSFVDASKGIFVESKVEAGEKQGFVLTPGKLEFAKQQPKNSKEEEKKVFDFSSFKFNLNNSASRPTNDGNEKGVAAGAQGTQAAGAQGTQQDFKFSLSQPFSTDSKPKNEDRPFQFAASDFEFGKKQENPFLAAAKNLFPSDKQATTTAATTTELPFNFTVNKQQSSLPQFGNISPFSFSNSAANMQGAQSTPFPNLQLQTEAVRPIATVPANANEESITDRFSPAQINVDSTSAGAYGAANYESLTAEQNAHFQNNWEAAQDQYYCEEDQYYVDDNGCYDNDEYYNGSGYYDDDEDDDEDGNVYYANDDGEVGYYDQETVNPVATGDSDANSDRQSPDADVANQEEPVPRVVQMIDEDVFVTFVKKASFAERAKAGRFQLPNTFFSPSSRPACCGCLGCSSSGNARPASREITTATSTIETSKSPTIKQDVVAVQPTLPGTGTILGATSSMMSFADFIKSNSNTSSPAFQTEAKSKGFSGAGKALFSGEKEQEDNYDPHYKAIVELEKKENQSSGEEGYVNLFKHRAKLYRFDSDSNQWKERGIGDMRLSHNPSNDYCRVIMRRDVIYKICANHPIMPDIELKPHDLSTTSLVWVAGADYSEGDPIVEKFAVKFKNIDICNEFKRVFEECQKTMLRYLDNTKKSDSDRDDAVAKGGDSKDGDNKDDENVASSSVWAKFTAKEGSWMCEVCDVQNMPGAVSCAACATAKPGATQIATKEVDNGDNATPFKFGDANGPVFGSSKPLSFPTTTFSASPILFGQQQIKDDLKATGGEGPFSIRDSPPKGLSEKKVEPKSLFAATTSDSSAVIKPVLTDSKQKEEEKAPPTQSSASVWSKFSGKEGSWVCDICEVRNDGDKTSCVACSTAKPGTGCTPVEKTSGNSSGLLFGSGNPAQSGFLFGSQKPLTFGVQPAGLFSFGQMPSGSKPVFGVSKATSELSNEVKTEVDWECPTCSMRNGKDNRNCSGCKTENPLNKDGRTTPIILQRSPLSEKGQISELKNLFAPSVGSWECPTCLIRNEATVQQCPACTTMKPSNNGNDSVSTSLPFQSMFSTPLSSGFKFGVTSQTPTTFQDVSADRSQYFTPSGSFTFGKQGDTTNDEKDSSSSIPPSFSLFDDKKTGPKSPESPSKENDHSLNFSPIVELTRKEHRITGEESEDVLFAEKCKLYRFDAETKQWKERGVGELKILLKKDSEKYRIVMRRDQVHKLCANHCLVSGMFLKPMDDSNKIFVWTTAADCSDEETKSETFAAKFRSVEVAKEFEKHFNESVSRTEKGSGNEEDEKEKSSVALAKEDEKGESKKDEVDVKGDEKSNRDEEVLTEEKVVEKDGVGFRVTYQFLPDEDEKKKAEKLLLPRDFFHLPSSQSKNEELENKDEENKTISVVTCPSPSSPEKYHNEEECKAIFTPLVELTKVDLKTGEELEEVLFCEKAKVYRFDSSVPQWKERGFGDLKMLKNRQSGQRRLIMRRDQVKKLCLNHLVLKGMKAEDGVMSKRTVVWFTLADISDGEEKAEKFTARFKTDDAVEQFKACFTEAAATAVSESDSVASSTKDSTIVLKETTSNEDESEKNSPSPTNKDEGKKFVTKSDIGNAELKEDPKVVTTSEDSKSVSDVSSLSNAASKPSFSFNFLSAKDDDSTKPKDSGKSLFDFTSKSYSEGGAGKFEFSFGPASGANHGSKDGAIDVPDSGSEPNSDTGPKTGPMFGAFGGDKPMGSLFSFNKADVKESKPAEQDKKEANSLIKPLFTFSSTLAEKGLQIDNQVKDEVKKEEDDHHAEEECKAIFEAIVTLHKKMENKTGEENDETIFSEKAKAYRYDSDGRQWKERGVGELKILKTTKSKQYRVVMRRDQVKKICINHLILPEMNIERNEASKNSWVWYTHADFSEEVPKAEKFAVRFRNEDTCHRFKECFDQVKSAILAEKEAGCSGVGADDDGGDSKRESDNGEAANSAAQDEKKCEEIKVVGGKVNDKEKISGQEDAVKCDEDGNVSGYKESAVTSDEDIEIVYVKEGSEDERKKAENLLLPALFFTRDNLVLMKSKPREGGEAANEQQPPSSKVFNFGFKTTGLSFSDLRSSGSTPGFMMKSNGKFENQGQVLFKSAVTEGSKEEGLEEETQIHFTPIVSLSKKEIKSGEEEEECLFDERCKLYRYDSDAVQWKERGVGKLKILHNKSRNNYRIVMRRDQVFKLCANHLIHADMVLSARPGTQTTWLWKTNADISDGDAQEEMFTARFKTEEIGKKFAEKIEMCCADLKSRGSSVDELAEAENEESCCQEERSKEEEDDQRDDRMFENRQEKKEDEKGNEFSKSFLKASMDGWECTDCLVFNDWNATKCIACECERKEGPTSDHQDKIQEGLATSQVTEDADKDTKEDHSTSSVDESSKVFAFGSGFSSLSFASLAGNEQKPFISSPQQAGGFSGVGQVLFSRTDEKDDHDPHYEPIVQLAKVETKSGEEDEAILFESRVKLYKFNSESKEWKERGVGSLKLLRHNDNKRARLIMRRDQVHKLCANHALVKGMGLERMTSSNRTLMWKTMADVSDGEQEETLLAARFKSDDLLQEFQNVFTMLCDNEEDKIEALLNAVTTPEERND